MTGLGVVLYVGAAEIAFWVCLMLAFFWHRRRPRGQVAVSYGGRLDIDAEQLVRAHPTRCHCHGTGVVDPTATPVRPCPVVWLPASTVAVGRVGRLPRAGVR